MTGKRIFGYRSNVRAAAQRERSPSKRETAAIGGLVVGAPFALLGVLLVVFGVFIVGAKFAFDLLSTLALVVIYPGRGAGVIDRAARPPGALGQGVTAAVVVALVLAIGGTLVWVAPWFGAFWYGAGVVSLVTWARGRARPGWLLGVAAMGVLLVSGPLTGLFLAGGDRTAPHRRDRTDERD